MLDLGTIGKVYFVLPLLQAAVSNEWSADTPSHVTAQRGLCARIPCHYRYPSSVVKTSWTGIWYNSDKANAKHIAFHSSDHSQEIQKFHSRTRLSGDLEDGDCSLVINNINRKDEGWYCFRIEFGGRYKFSYLPATWLHVTDFTDKPTIFAAELVEGPKSVNITCIFNTTCDGTSPTLTWVTPTDVPPSVSSSVTQWNDTLTYTSVLTMTPALKHHGQSLTCRVRYPSVSSEQTLTLTVQYAPQNLSVTSTNSVNNSWVNMKEGIPTSIFCSVQSFPASNLRWKHLGVTLNRTRSSNKLWLEFPQVTPQQAGDYRCVAKNKHGTAEGAVTVTVEYAPQNLTIISPNNMNNSWVNMKEGFPTLILCSVQSFPVSNLTWRHHGVTLNTTSSSNELWLEFPQVTPQQAGVYECVAENEHGTAERAITLSVEYAPQNLSITSPNNMNNSRVNMKEGVHTSILCSVQSFPVSNLTWRHLGVTLNTTSSRNELWLEFPQVTPQQAGVYECVAENEHGTAKRAITLTVEYAPQNLSITSPNNVNNSWVNMKEGVHTSILCSVQSFPVSNLTWRHLGVTLNTTNSSNELWLQFPQVTPQQAGVYECLAENEHGTAERAITLSVEYAPQNLSITSPNNVNNSWVNMKEGVHTSILCSVQSFPVSNLTWRHLGVTLNTTNSSNELWLQFPQVTPQQAGVYECLAENEHGTAERAITLSVEYKPEISPDSGCTRTSEVISCVCAARSNPPGEFTWHLPLANLSGNQTHGRFQTWQVEDGQLVAGSLTLGVEGEEDVTAFCTVRNQHGEVMFTVSLWMKDFSDPEQWLVSGLWITVLLTINVVLCVLLAGFFIYKYIPKRDRRTKETALEILDTTVSSSASLTTPQDAERQRTSQIPPIKSIGEEEECGPVYASLRELPGGGGPVRRGETVTYAELHFQSIGPA
ncbi:sialic acid-binding Ig-like lectin 10 [Mobula hypostoma]|uniref:sialic acid-binding Ig-like lectin 10 n=1 Tax=Mobula hypostoma TaxID=723540 RepID=UPI002FC350B4